MKSMIVLSLSAAFSVLTPANAAVGSSADQVNALEQRARLTPNDGGTQIELAQAYRNASRPQDAAAAYRKALQLDNEMMETRNGDAIWSHEVARRTLTTTAAIAAR